MEYQVLCLPTHPAPPRVPHRGPAQDVREAESLLYGIVPTGTHTLHVCGSVSPPREILVLCVHAGADLKDNSNEREQQGTSWEDSRVLGRNVIDPLGSD